jgi:hypothetical protein
MVIEVLLEIEVRMKGLLLGGSDADRGRLDGRAVRQAELDARAAEYGDGERCERCVVGVTELQLLPRVPVVAGLADRRLDGSGEVLVGLVVGRAQQVGAVGGRLAADVTDGALVV